MLMLPEARAQVTRPLATTVLPFFSRNLVFESVKE